MSDSSVPQFPDEAIEAIGKSKVFSGGIRHRNIVGEILPFGYEWIDIKPPLDAVFRQFDKAFSDGTQTIVVFASGDPLFFGFANTVLRKLPGAEIHLFPYFNSLQTLAHRSLTRYDDMLMVSLTGRPWREFDNALIRRTKKIGVLTDREHTPSAIAQRMIDYGYADYEMIVGERLGNVEHEKVSRLTLDEASRTAFDNPNCLIVNQLSTSNLQLSTNFGLADNQFELLDGRTKMITKAPIRLLSLQAMELPKHTAMWDVGFCTGSVSIEARLIFPHLKITAFEIRPECERLMHINSRRFGAPGIETVMGDFMDIDLSSYPAPDAVFIGGHGGRLREMMTKIKNVLSPGGCIVFNSVTAESRKIFEQTAKELCLELKPPMRIALNDFNPITIMKCSL